MQSEKNTHVRTSYSSSQSRAARELLYPEYNCRIPNKKKLQQELWLLKELSRYTENQGRVVLSFCRDKDNA